MKQAICVALVGIAMTVQPAVPADQSDMRTWTDVEGRTVEASLVSSSDSAVKLKKRDGKVYSVPLDRLSQTDRAFVEMYFGQENFLNAVRMKAEEMAKKKSDVGQTLTNSPPQIGEKAHWNTEQIQPTDKL